VCLIRETKNSRSVGVPPGTGLGNTALGEHGDGKKIKIKIDGCKNLYFNTFVLTFKTIVSTQEFEFAHKTCTLSCKNIAIHIEIGILSKKYLRSLAKLTISCLLAKGVFAHKSHIPPKIFAFALQNICFLFKDYSVNSYILFQIYCVPQ